MSSTRNINEEPSTSVAEDADENPSYAGRGRGVHIENLGNANDGVSIPAHSICLPSMGMNFPK